MALRQTETLKGVEIQNGYWRAETLLIQRGRCRAYFKLYSSQEVAQESEGRNLDSTVVDFDIDLKGSNPVQQAYVAAKATSRFSTAEDVLEDNKTRED
jgi:hypothetical protein